ncbi:MAG: hypothetical protein HQL87_18580 [Magnetococcales bacterium]|nr:hypothetical protein [Magnetococcales bacterium]
MAVPENVQDGIDHKTHWHRLLGKALEESLTPVNVSVQTEVDVVSGSPKADIMRPHCPCWVRCALFY